MPNEKVFDLGPSLLDEMDYMFKSMSTISEQSPQSLEFDNTNKRNEMSEITSKLNRKNSSDACSSSLGKIIWNLAMTFFIILY